MKSPRVTKSAKAVSVKAKSPLPYNLRLYVAGSNLKSAQAIKVVHRVCGMFPEGRCTAEVIDLYQHPELARQDNIIALPRLVRVQPLPRLSFVGSTQDTNRILQKLGIPALLYAKSKSQAE